MTEVEQLRAEVEALKIVVTVMCRHQNRFRWREVRDVAKMAAAKDAEWRLSHPWTDQQLGRIEDEVDFLTGTSMPDWQPPPPPPAARERRAKPR